MTQALYPSDLTDKEWQRLAPLVSRPHSWGRPRKYPLRASVKAIFSVLRTGCQWRALPHDLPQWKTVPHYFRVWRRQGGWIAVTAALRQQVRLALGRKAQPSAGISDRQSVKTTSGGGERGYEGAKKVKGRKRPLLVDTQGGVLRCKVPPADGMDRDGGMQLLPPEPTQAAFPRLAPVGLAAGDNGKDKGQEWIERQLGWTTAVVGPPPRRVLVAADVEPAPRPFQG